MPSRIGRMIFQEIPAIYIIEKKRIVSRVVVPRSRPISTRRITGPQIHPPATNTRQNGARSIYRIRSERNFARNSVRITFEYSDGWMFPIPGTLIHRCAPLTAGKQKSAIRSRREIAIRNQRLQSETFLKPKNITPQSPTPPTNAHKSCLTKNADPAVPNEVE